MSDNPETTPPATVPPTQAVKPMRYTGEGTPDMAVDYMPGDDPGSIENQDTRETVNTMPPPLREGEGEDAADVDVDT